MVTSPTTPDIAPPNGASADHWQDDGHREVYVEVGRLAVSSDFLRCPSVHVNAEQYRDGTLGAIDVQLDGGDGRGLSAGQARELAALLNAAADVADRWAAGCTTCRDWDSCPHHPKARNEAAVR